MKELHRSYEIGALDIGNVISFAGVRQAYIIVKRVEKSGNTYVQQCNGSNPKWRGTGRYADPSTTVVLLKEKHEE